MRIAADYTTRANYQDNYRKANRDAINARKRAWRKEKKTNQTTGCDSSVMKNENPKPQNPNPNPNPPPGK